MAGVSVTTAGMSFDDSPLDAEFRSAARSWLEQNAIPAGHPDDFSDEFWGIDARPQAEQQAIGLAHTLKCREWQARLNAGGWAGLAWPVEFGGRGVTPTQAAIFAEEQSRFGVTNDSFVVAIAMVGPTIIAHGTEAQKARFLPAMLNGEHIWCQLFSEPGAGSDLAGLRTRAVRDGDEFVINGQKVWTSSAETADWAILLARTDGEVPKHRGITYFLIDMRQPGIEVRPLRQMTGGAHFSEVFMTDLRVPTSAVLGEVNGGWSVAMTTLANERALIGGGLHFSASDLISLARRYGKADNPVVRCEIAEVHIREQVLRFLGFRVRTATEQGRAPGPEANCMKLLVAQYLTCCTNLALSIAGAEGTGLGVVVDHTATWQHHFLAAPSIHIAGGSDEVQRNIIAERVLGLPAEVRLDKSVPFRELEQTRSTRP